MSLGKQIRLSAWIKSNRTFLIALDEVIPRGLTPSSMITETLISDLIYSPIDGLVVHPGIAMRFGKFFVEGCPWIAKITSNSQYAQDITIRGTIGSVQQALMLGASGISVNVFLGSTYESEQLSFLARCVEEGYQWGMPVIAYMNPPTGHEFDPAAIAYASRVGAEIGADVIKTNFCGDVEDFKQVITQALVPVIIEYSPLPETQDGTLDTVRGALASGAVGVHFGQHIIDLPNRIELISSIARLIHNRSANES